MLSEHAQFICYLYCCKTASYELQSFITQHVLLLQERATLKHSRVSKWAKEQLSRKHRDPSVSELTESSTDIEFWCLFTDKKCSGRTRYVKERIEA